MAHQSAVLIVTVLLLLVHIHQEFDRREFHWGVGRIQWQGLFLLSEGVVFLGDVESDRLFVTLVGPIRVQDRILGCLVLQIHVYLDEVLL